MANDTCEATITKRLACWWRHQQLVAMSFLYLFTLFQKYTKNHKYNFFYVPTSSYFTALLFSILCFPFFSFFQTLKNFRHTRESTGEASIASHPCGFVSFQPICYNGNIEEAKAHTLISNFKTILFVCGFPPITECAAEAWISGCHHSSFLPALLLINSRDSSCCS